MPNMYSFKLVTSIAASLLVVSTIQPSQAASDRPVAGQCWNATGEQALNWSSWEGGTAVPCSEQHTLVTWAVVDVKGDFPTPASDQSFYNFSVAADKACVAAKGPIPNKTVRISYYLFLPTIEQFDQGARWTRCDFGMLSLGSTNSLPILEKMNRGLAEQVSFVQVNRKLFSLCYKSYSASASTLNSATGGEYRVVDCSARPIWAWGNTIVHTSKSFPYKGSSYSKFVKICEGLRPAKTGWGRALLWTPTPTGWSLGYRSTQCFYLRN